MNISAKMDRAGRLSLPLKIRRELGLNEHSDLVVRVEDGGLRIQTREAALQRLQERLQRYQRPGRSIVDEFLLDRRQEASRETKRK
jgi:bifunctional DNA-binding transcriptional regulator/antitoxin component of YhaV-PrlF toxin-antitoxin module